VSRNSDDKRKSYEYYNQDLGSEEEDDDSEDDDKEDEKEKYVKVSLIFKILSCIKLIVNSL
jgi:hypothetical protein